MAGFWLGALFGFLDEEYVNCPHCGCEFLPEEMPHDDGDYVCPACLRPLDESEVDEGDEEEQDLE